MEVGHSTVGRSQIKLFLGNNSRINHALSDDQSDLGKSSKTGSYRCCTTVSLSLLDGKRPTRIPPMKATLFTATMMLPRSAMLCKVTEAFPQNSIPAKARGSGNSGTINGRLGAHQLTAWSKLALCSSPARAVIPIHFNFAKNEWD